MTRRPGDAHPPGAATPSVRRWGGRAKRGDKQWVGCSLDVAGVQAEAVHVTAPGGYGFVVVDEDVPAGSTAITQLSLNVTDLDKSLGESLGSKSAAHRDICLVGSTPTVLQGQGPVSWLIQRPAARWRCHRHARVGIGRVGHVLRASDASTTRRGGHTTGHARRSVPPGAAPLAAQRGRVLTHHCAPRQTAKLARGSLLLNATRPSPTP